MKRITRHLISGMATAGIALSASGLGLPIPAQPLSSTPALGVAPQSIDPESVNALSWTPGDSVAPGWDRDALNPTATMETISHTWDAETAPNLIGFSTLGVTTPSSQLTNVGGASPSERLPLRPMAGEARFNPLHGPASLSEPTTFTLLALGLACLAIRDSLARKRIRPAASAPATRDAVTQRAAAHVSQGALMCVPKRDTRPFDCTPIARSHKSRRRRRA